MPPKVERIQPKANEDDLRAKIEYGEQARRVMETPIVVDALDHMRQTATHRWETAETPDAREEQYQIVKSIRAFRKLFEAAMTQGNQARADLDKARNPTKGHRLNTP